MEKPGPLRALHDLNSERREGPLVERAAPSQIPDAQGQVVDERKRHAGAQASSAAKTVARFARWTSSGVGGSTSSQIIAKPLAV